MTKYGRIFNRCCSAYTYYTSVNKPLRFLTLTLSKASVDGLSDYDAGVFLSNSFILLRKRIRRRFGFFEYLKVRTNEGNGVLHILYAGCYIPYAWLRCNWNEITGSFIIDIRKVFSKDGIGNYLKQYLSNQKCSYVRSNLSYNFVFRGFVTYWNFFKSYFCRIGGLFYCIDKWENFLKGKTTYIDYFIIKIKNGVVMRLIQANLDGGLIDDLIKCCECGEVKKMP
ncbi:MAG: hypothetical protein ACQXXF_07525 [Thermoplasmatota archaeon]